MSESKPVSITDDQFEQEIINCDDITLVDFWAPWCGPCVTMAPQLEAFADANTGRVKVCKLDVDDNPKTAERYEIRSVPTLIFFKGGEPVDISAGAVSQSTLQTKLDKLL